MSHLTAFDPSRDNESIPDGAIENSCLSVRTGKMSFIQYGFNQDPGINQVGSFHSDRVILLVLNDHRHVRYQIESDSDVLSLNSQQLKDHVCILWPKAAGTPPPELSPEQLFEHTATGTRGQEGELKWPRDSYRTQEGASGDWDAALIYMDPSGNYSYEYRSTNGTSVDDYRFALGSEEVVAWLWKRGEAQPQLMLDEGKTVTRALQAQSGGTQGEGGALPYPPG